MLKINIKLLLFVFTSIVFSQSEITDSRNNAITNSIKIASPAVASINVTQVQKYSINPFQQDPWFQYFFPPQALISVYETGPLHSPRPVILRARSSRRSPSPSRRSPLPC